MAKTAYSIQMDYNKAIQQANQLDECARKVKGQIAKLQYCRQRVSDGWQGDNAKAYLNKISIMERNLADSEKKLRKAATTVRNVARRTYQAEQRALELAKTRVY